MSKSVEISIFFKVYEAIALGRTETIENQPNARSALRLEALLPDPIAERKEHKKQKHELNSIVNREEQFRGQFFLSDFLFENLIIGGQIA